MVNEELYIIVNGERKKLDLPSPSGITLNFVSNLFNDLSKINASYSYTFKLPRTVNNARVLEIVDDVRSDGRFTKIKNEAEFLYDGVALFSNANMYISGIDNNTISAVLTWNVNKGLQELSEHDMSLNELGNHLPEGEYDYDGTDLTTGEIEKDKVVLIGKGTYDDHSSTPASYRKFHYSQSRIRPDFDKWADYDPTVPYFRSLHNSGIPPYFYLSDSHHSLQGSLHFSVTYPLFENYTDGKLAPLPYIVTSDEHIKRERLKSFVEGEYEFPWDDDGYVNFHTFAFPTPIIPVPYIMSVIEKVFGINFGLSGDLYNSLCVPLATTKMSDVLARQSYVRLNFIESSHQLMGIEATPWIMHNGINPISNVQVTNIQIIPDIWESFVAALSFTTPINSFSKAKILVDGKVTFKVRASASGVTSKNPKLTLSCKTYESVPHFYEIGSIEASDIQWYSYYDENHNAVYCEEITFNCNPDEGFKIFESEYFYNNIISFTLTHDDDEPYGLMGDATGYLNMYIRVDDYPMGCSINLFKNLPDISCLDFVKSIFFALGSYPYQDKDNIIKMQQYTNIVQRIKEHDVCDWSAKSLKGLGDNTEAINYESGSITSLTLGRKNYILMKNDSIDEYGNEKKNNKLEDAYEQGYACISVESDMLDKVQTLFTFPFYGGFLWQKDLYYRYNLTHKMPLATNIITCYCYNTSLNGEIGYDEIYEGSLSFNELIGQDRWVIDDDNEPNAETSHVHFLNDKTTFYVKSQEAKPMLGVVEPISVPVASLEEWQIGGDTGDSLAHILRYKGQRKQYLSMRPWNCNTDMPKVNGYNIQQEMLGNPCLVKEDMCLNAIDLATLDIEKPVYLEKYNSYFAIKSVEVSSEGVSKVELVRIPSEILNEPVPTSEIEVND